jgi:hypothetical protein
MPNFHQLVGSEGKGLRLSTGALLALILVAARVEAGVPPAIEGELVKLGHGVFPACVAKLYRPLMPDNDYNTYWPPDATAPDTDVTLYPGVTIARDVRFGPDPKDLIDIFVGRRGGSRDRTVLIYVPGGAGNKIEQQAPQSNAFYDNIGRWATQNGMVAVTMQRHGGTPPGADIAAMIGWLEEHVADYRGNPDRMFIWAHSAGNVPLGAYIGRPDLYGIGVKGAIFMSGNPVNFGAGGGLIGGFGADTNGSECSEIGGMGAVLGAIRGPSSQLPDAGANAALVRQTGLEWNGAAWVGEPPTVADAGAGRFGGRGGGPGRAGGPGGARGRGAPGGPGRAGGGPPPGFGGGGQLSPGLSLQDGFRTTRTAIMLAWSELDPGVDNAEMPAGAVAIHDELCKLEGPNAKDGVGHCPTMFMAKEHSHVSEVFSIGTDDTTVSDAVLGWIESVP